MRYFPSLVLCRPEYVQLRSHKLRACLVISASLLATFQFHSGLADAMKEEGSIIVCV